MSKYILSTLLILSISTYALYVQVGGATIVKNQAVVSTVPMEPTSTTQTTVVAPVIVYNPTPVSTPVPAPLPEPVPVVVDKPKGLYLDGQYDGESFDAFYGQVQVRVIIEGGKLVDVQFLDYPHDRGTSRSINSRAMSGLKEEAVAIQGYKVNTVSGATDTSGAFRQSLKSALAKAKNV